ncbi:MAG: hypothetical protein A2X86_00375 [Bdellovibrionales bacterium GWA2_49_15]|nr:MAG: hypothetical protein A2X86_00375 [Bdellovibrionales bacterium GWA2_49_15]HAZ14498.1 hypothetical protein [Bdellovibrionales bacterium]
MVFPSIFFNMETGSVAQFSTLLIVAFSYCLHRWKKVVLFSIIIFLALVGARSAFAAMGGPGVCGTSCLAQRNYYGAPYGRAPFYAYPQMYPSYMGNNNWQFSSSPYMQPDCVQCRMQGQYPNYAQPPWATYGMNNYSNYSYPGAWGWGGMNGGAYPGHAPGMMGKPNVYFSGRSGTQVKVKMQLAPENNILAAVPIIGEEGWSFRLGKNNVISADGANYGYLFYDYRTGLDSFQFDKGFCTSHAEVIPKMATILKNLDFKQKEVADFTDYWSVKMPASEEYCVYPQVESEIKGSVALQVTPTPSKNTRVFFFVLPKEIMGHPTLQKYTQRPSSEWTLPAARTVASAGGLELREWGVGFLTSWE